jgi:hypothetical protein
MKYSITRVLTSLVMGTLLFGAVGFVVMQLWNWLIPSIFHSETIDLWQAFGLLALSKILFANFGSNFWGNHHKCNQCGGSGLFQQKEHWREKMKAKMETMSPDEREDFKAQMKNVCSGVREKNDVQV